MAILSFYRSIPFDSWNVECLWNLAMPILAFAFAGPCQESEAREGSACDTKLPATWQQFQVSPPVPLPGNHVFCEPSRKVKSTKVAASPEGLKSTNFRHQ